MSDPRMPSDAAGTCQLRLCLQSGIPISSNGLTSQATIYLTPYVGNAIGLKVGGVWRTFNTAEISKGLGTLTADRNYDIFAYWDGSAVQLEFSAAWNSDGVTRTDAITRDTLGGVWVKNSDATRLLVGTFRTTTTTTTEDSDGKQYIWNVFNPVYKRLIAREATNTWNYTTATWRAYNGGGSPTAFVEMVRGLNDHVVYIIGHGVASNSGTGAGVAAATGIGLDSTTVNSAQMFGGLPTEDNKIMLKCYYMGYPAVGYHKFNLLEISTATNTTSWYGDNGLSQVVSGIHGRIKG